MKKNVGSVDRVVRMVLGLAILGVGYWYGSWWGLLGLVVLFTAFVRWCPVYLPFGISTIRKSS